MWISRVTWYISTMHGIYIIYGMRLHPGEIPASAQYTSVYAFIPIYALIMLHARCFML